MVYAPGWRVSRIPLIRIMMVKMKKRMNASGLGTPGEYCENVKNIEIIKWYTVHAGERAVYSGCKS